jgi:hypothetical protein
MSTMEKFLVVIRPVADIRRKPVDAKPQYVHDDLQETQVLYNELLLYRDETEDWYHVEAAEQRRTLREGLFQGYPGWIRKRSVAAVNDPPRYNGVVREKICVVREDPSEKSDTLISLSIGTRLKIGESDHATHYQVVAVDGKIGWVKKRDVNILGYRQPESTLRKAIMGAAKLFLGVPYLWGGRSMHMPDLMDNAADPLPRPTPLKTHNSKLKTAVLTGVDCSGFTNLVFRVNDIDIPRDARDQWLTAEKIGWDRLKPGDLIFLSAEDMPDSAVHVLLSAGRDEFFEAEETGSMVRLTDFSDKFGADLGHLANQGFNTSGSRVSFGRVIPRYE